MNQFKTWQIGLIYSVLIIGIIFAMPNFYPTKPALQVAFGASASVLNKNITQEIASELESKEIGFEKIELNENSLKIIFNDVEDQLAGRRTLAEYSDGDFIIALNSEPSTPEWLRSIGGKPVNLGLDLAGGIHFLLEVDTERYSEERLSSEGASLVEEFLSRNINSSYSSTENEIKLAFTNSNNLDQAREYLNQNNFITTGSKYAIIQSGNNINLQYTDEYLSEIVDYAVEQNIPMEILLSL